MYSQTLTTTCLRETNALGQRIGASLTPGTVIALTGDLGSGKTAFVQGLARGLDIPEGYYITSPTYTLINEYPGRHPFFHIDLYRLDDPDSFEDIGLYDILHGRGIVAVEWAERIPEDTLAEHITIHFEVLDDESRKIRITAPEAFSLRKAVASAVRSET